MVVPADQLLVVCMMDEDLYFNVLSSHLLQSLMLYRRQDGKVSFTMWPHERNWLSVGVLSSNREERG